MALYIFRGHRAQIRYCQISWRSFILSFIPCPNSKVELFNWTEIHTSAATSWSIFSLLQQRFSKPSYFCNKGYQLPRGKFMSIWIVRLLCILLTFVVTIWAKNIPIYQLKVQIIWFIHKPVINNQNLIRVLFLVAELKALKIYKIHVC